MSINLCFHSKTPAKYVIMYMYVRSKETRLKAVEFSLRYLPSRTFTNDACPSIIRCGFSRMHHFHSTSPFPLAGPLIPIIKGDL